MDKVRRKVRIFKNNNEPWFIAALNDFTRRQNEYKAIASQRGRDLQSCKGELASLNKEGRELWRTYQPDLLEEAE